MVKVSRIFRPPGGSKEPCVPPKSTDDRLNGFELIFESSFDCRSRSDSEWVRRKFAWFIITTGSLSDPAPMLGNMPHEELDSVSLWSEDISWSLGSENRISGPILFFATGKNKPSLILWAGVDWSSESWWNRAPLTS